MVWFAPSALADPAVGRIGAATCAPIAGRPVWRSGRNRV